MYEWILFVLIVISIVLLTIYLFQYIAKQKCINNLTCLFRGKEEKARCFLNKILYDPYISSYAKNSICYIAKEYRAHELTKQDFIDLITNITYNEAVLIGNYYESCR